MKTRPPFPMPRRGSFYGMPIHNHTFPDGTWLEGEEFAYPSGGFTRRAFARIGNDGAPRVVRCSIPDTFFTIPARLRQGGRTVRGYLAIKDAGEASETIVFHRTAFQGE